MKIAILGYGAQGRSAHDYWRDGNEITVCDQNEYIELPDDVAAQLGPDHLKHLDGFDVIVRSPFVHPRDIVAANSDAILEKVTTVTNEFLRVCPTTNVIGVTGTKGKGTTSTLIAHMLASAGKTVHLGGNIGIPPLDLLKQNIQKDDWVVLELANFQLIDLQTSPHIAVCVLVAPEHLDWHASLEEYYEAKRQLFLHQQTSDIAIYYANNELSRQIASSSPGIKIPYMAAPGAVVSDNAVVIADQIICRVDELKLLGRHNWQNVCAAVTAIWQITQDVEALHRVLINFSGLSFRIELRREVNGVRYYNDSFASAPPATLAAVEAVPGPKVLIIGGFERGLDLTELTEGLTQHQSEIRKILLIGQSANRTAEALRGRGFDNFQFCQATDMPTIVREATNAAREGDAVILSPAFASFDMFKNFEDRGLQFNEAVEKL
jgi:UDP-N-acetylmuramoylalanine--D-glutamate ligase